MRRLPHPPMQAPVLRRLATLPPGLVTALASFSAVAVVAVHAGLWHAAHAILLVVTAYFTWVNWRRLRAPWGRIIVVALLVLSVPIESFRFGAGAGFAVAELPLVVVLATLTLESPRLHQLVLRSYVGFIIVAIFATRTL